jgi:hypothetical protein
MPQESASCKSNVEEEAGVNATGEVEQEANMFVSIKEHIVHNAVD